MRYHDIPGYGVSFPAITSLIQLYAEYKLIDTYIPKSNSRATIGTKTSQLLDRILKGGHIDDKEWGTLNLKTRRAVLAALKWQKATGFKPKESESLVYSLRFGIAGHPDTIGIIRPWWICVIDWKIGDINNIRVSLQIPTYGFCYLEMYPRRRIDGFRAVHLDTEKATYQERIIPYEEGEHWFNEFIRMKLQVGIL